MSVAEQVADIPLFRGATDKERERLLRFAIVDSFEADQILFTEGRVVGQVMYVVLSGAVVISKHGTGTDDKPLAVLRRGAFFGEMSLFEQEARSATATVKEKSELLVITKVAFDRMMKSDPEIANKLLLVFIKTLSQRLRQTTSLYAG